MANVMALVAQISANTAGIRKGASETSKQLQGIKKSADSASAALRKLVAIEFSKIFARATASVGGFVDNVRQSVGELTRLSAVSNANVEQFQGLAYGAKSVGIEQDKLADILKDVNDRVGDFLTTGAGPMADFFEQIAPRIGLTANEFKGLSGPQALQLYVSSLEKANVNQQEMTFFLEAMSSDLTLLLPLLKNGGEGFANLAAEAEGLSLVLGAEQVGAIQEMNRALGRVQQTIQGIIARVTAELAPRVTAIVDEFLRFVQAPEGLGGAQNIADGIAEGLIRFADGLAGVFDFALAGLRGFAADMDSTFGKFQAGADILDRGAAAFELVGRSFMAIGLFRERVRGEANALFGNQGGEELAAAAAQIQAENRRGIDNALDRILGRERPGPAGAPDAAGGVGPIQAALRNQFMDVDKALQEAAMRQEEGAAEAALSDMLSGVLLGGIRSAQARLQEQLRPGAGGVADFFGGLRKQIVDGLEKTKQTNEELAVLYAERDGIEKLRIENAAKLNNLALQVADIRAGGIASVIALATGREDPALEEARQQRLQLEEINRNIRNLGGTVEIAGAA